MLRNKGFRALAGLLSAAMLTVGLATSMTQAAQAAQASQVSLQNPTVSAASTTTAFNTPVSLKPTATSSGTDLRFCLVAPALSPQQLQRRTVQPAQ